tara:strand:- start:171 stop:749 length:579 start_codon:yes stop_codon:yes gene_type:complete
MPIFGGAIIGGIKALAAGFKGATALNKASMLLSGGSMAYGAFVNKSERDRAASDRAATKKMAIQGQSDLRVAAKRADERSGVRQGFINQNIGIQSESFSREAAGNMRSLESNIGMGGLYGSGSANQLREDMAAGIASQGASMSLAAQQDRFGEAQRRESELRDIQNSMLELSVYTGRNYNILDTYGISNNLS